jgi:hypothetical protein
MMKKRFRQLYRKAHKEGDLYSDRILTKAFPDVVSQSHLNYWCPGDPIEEKGQRILVGIAPGWDELDIKLLDGLDGALSQERFSDYHIDVFDISTLERMQDLKQYLPDLEKAYHTPLVGLWKNGVFQKSIWGYDGRMFLAELFGFADELRQS